MGPVVVRGSVLLLLPVCAVLGLCAVSGMEDPLVELFDFHVFDITGDIDSVLDAGEIGVVEIALRNTGNETAVLVTATISTEDPLIKIVDAYSARWGNIEPGTTEWSGQDSFQIQVLPTNGNTGATVRVTTRYKNSTNHVLVQDYTLNIPINEGYFRVHTDKDWYMVDDTVVVTATLKDKMNRSTPLLEASVTANITRSGLPAVREPLVLYDDGTHGDPVSSDGRYTNSYPLGGERPMGYYRIDAGAWMGDQYAKTHAEFRIFGYGPPRLDWEKSHGGDKGERGSGIVQSGDGGFVIAGYTTSYGVEAEDIYILKVDADGNKVWEETYGWGKDDRAMDIVQCSDGGFILVGYANRPYRISDQTPPNVCLLKVDADGNKVWEKLHEGHWATGAYCITQGLDGGFIVGGVKDVPDGGKNMNLWVFKIDEHGETVWERTYGGRGDERAYDIIQTGDGGYMVAGFSDSFGEGDGDVYVLKLDGEGREVWERTYGGSGTDKGLSIVRSFDRDYVVVGKTETSPGHGMYLLKIDEYGEMIWERTYRNAETAFDVASSEEGFIVTGFTQTSGPLTRWVYLLKIDREGEMVWKWVWGRHGESAEGGPIVKSGDGGFIMASYNKYLPSARGDDVYLLKIRDEPWAPVPELPLAMPALSLAGWAGLCTAFLLSQAGPARGQGM